MQQNNYKVQQSSVYSMYSIVSFATPKQNKIIHRNSLPLKQMIHSMSILHITNRMTNSTQLLWAHSTRTVTKANAIYNRFINTRPHNWENVRQQYKRHAVARKPHKAAHFLLHLKTLRLYLLSGFIRPRP